MQQRSRRDALRVHRPTIGSIVRRTARLVCGVSHIRATLSGVAIPRLLGSEQTGPGGADILKPVRLII
jgi:hypothetical protein